MSNPNLQAYLDSPQAKAYKRGADARSEAINRMAAPYIESAAWKRLEFDNKKYSPDVAFQCECGDVVVRAEFYDECGDAACHWLKGNEDVALAAFNQDEFFEFGRVVGDATAEEIAEYGWVMTREIHHWIIWTKEAELNKIETEAASAN